MVRSHKALNVILRRMICSKEVMGSHLKAEHEQSGLSFPKILWCYVYGEQKWRDSESEAQK